MLSVQQSMYSSRSTLNDNVNISPSVRIAASSSKLHSKYSSYMPVHLTLLQTANGVFPTVDLLWTLGKTQALGASGAQEYGMSNPSNHVTAMSTVLVKEKDY